MHRIPNSPEIEGLIVLSPPVLPSCSVSAPVVNPGSVTRVRAEGLPSGETANLFLGGDLVNAGNIDVAGVADIELPIPRTSSAGLRSVTMQIGATLFSAACEVEIVGHAVPRRARTPVEQPPLELR
jgi:hypothetical protein